MFLHIGSQFVLWEGSIIGVFNIRTTTTSQITKEFLLEREKKRSLIRITKKGSKSFILTDKKEVFFSPIESSTLIRRLKKRFYEGKI